MVLRRPVDFDVRVGAVVLHPHPTSTNQNEYWGCVVPRSG
jgi:hypothetical protein